MSRIKESVEQCIVEMKGATIKGYVYVLDDNDIKTIATKLVNQGSTDIDTIMDTIKLRQRAHDPAKVTISK